MSEAVDTVNGREATYGHPWDDFTMVQTFMRIWDKRRNNSDPELDTDYEACVKHVVYMMFVKLARLSKSPSHYDSILDLGGYAETLMRCHKRAFPEPVVVKEFKYVFPHPMPGPNVGEIPLDPNPTVMWQGDGACSHEEFEEMRRKIEQAETIPMGTFEKVPMNQLRHRIMMREREGRPLGEAFIGGPNAEEAAKPPPPPPMIKVEYRGPGRDLYLDGLPALEFYAREEAAGRIVLFRNPELAKRESPPFIPRGFTGLAPTPP